jgi:hypothetical protein
MHSKVLRAIVLCSLFIPSLNAASVLVTNNSGVVLSSNKASFQYRVEKN